jgi:hypothetical protein
MLLNFPEHMKKLDTKQQWATALDRLFEEWLNKKDNLDRLLCLSTALWYYLEFEDELDYYRKSKDKIDTFIQIDRENLMSRLAEVTDFGMEHFQNDFRFNMFFGFMISMFPYFFYGDFDTLREQAFQMGKKACELEPDNPVPRIWYYGYFSNHPLYAKAKKEAAPLVKKLFPENGSEVECYFRDMLLP